MGRKIRRGKENREGRYMWYERESDEVIYYNYYFISSTIYFI